MAQSAQGAEVVEDSDLENSFQAALVSESPLFSNLAPCPVARCSYLDRDFSPGVPNQAKLFTGRGALIRKKQGGLRSALNHGQMGKNQDSRTFYKYEALATDQPDLSFKMYNTVHCTRVGKLIYILQRRIFIAKQKVKLVGAVKDVAVC